MLIPLLQFWKEKRKKRIFKKLLMTHISRVNKTWKVGTTMSMLFKLKKLLNFNSKMTEKSLWITNIVILKEIIILKPGLNWKGWICVWSIWKKEKNREKIRKQLITNSEQVFFKPVFLARSLFQFQFLSFSFFMFNQIFIHLASTCSGFQKRSKSYSGFD